MLESLYNRGNIVKAVVNLYLIKKEELGNPRQTDLVRSYFTRTLGSEPISTLLARVNPRGVAMDINNAYAGLDISGKQFLRKAMGYGIAGVLYCDLNQAVFADWSTSDFFDNLNNLFLSRAHLDRPPFDNSSNSKEMLENDARIARLVRETVMVSDKNRAGKIGDFFASHQQFSRLSPVADILRLWLPADLMGQILEGGQSFQLGLDAITVKTSSSAKKFI